ncbi:MAG: class I SAM-dependent methyltransferase [Candidatus Binatia bacterium]
MNTRLDELYEQCPRLTPHYIREVLKLTGERADLVANITGGISRPEAELLCRLVDEIDPVVSVEVGLGYGFSAFVICASGCRPKRERRHVVIDPHQKRYWNDRGIRHLTEAGFGGMVELREERSYRVLPELERAGVRLDFAFVDGWHTFDFVTVDFFFIDKMLRKGGVVAFDDADWASIRPLLRYIVTNLPYTVVGTLPEKRAREPLDVELGLEGSLIALRKESGEDSRDIFFHRPFA